MKIKDLLSILNSWAPPALQESYDNCGLIVGDSNAEISGALICLDSTEIIVDEAIELGYNVIIAHHPIVFSGLKKLNGGSYVEKTIIKAIRNDIAIIALHTNLDNIQDGVSFKMAEILGLTNVRVLKPKNHQLAKLVTYVPIPHAEALKASLFDAGAGHIGEYDECSFSVIGEGSFRPSSNANPVLGEKGKRFTGDEIRLEVIVRQWMKRDILGVLKKNHPYEEVAYEWIPLENDLQTAGSGAVGDLSKPLSPEQLLELVKTSFGGMIRYTKARSANITTIAICGGSGSFLLNDAVAAGADCFITSDVKYHQFFDALNNLMYVDIGHFEGERFTMNLIHDYLKEKIPNFAARLTVNSTNPIHYF